MSEPGAALAQGSERWHGRSVAVEVIPGHAIQDDQHDNSRSTKIGPQDRQYTACYGREHLHAERSRKRWRNILLHGPASSTVRFSPQGPQTSAESRRHTSTVNRACRPRQGRAA
jgi:hypothetical protein